MGNTGKHENETEQMSIRIGSDFLKNIKVKIAQDGHRNFSELVRKLLKDWLSGK